MKQTLTKYQIYYYIAGLLGCYGLLFAESRLLVVPGFEIVKTALIMLLIIAIIRLCVKLIKSFQGWAKTVCCVLIAIVSITSFKFIVLLSRIGDEMHVGSLEYQGTMYYIYDVGMIDRIYIPYIRQNMFLRREFADGDDRPEGLSEYIAQTLGIDINEIAY